MSFDRNLLPSLITTCLLQPLPLLLLLLLLRHLDAKTFVLPTV
jgi:hypothetical protein